MGQVSYNSVLKISGTPIGFQDLATTLIPSTDSYQINDVDKRVIDRATTPIVNVGSSSVSSGYDIDYIQGIIKFSVPQSDVVTITGKYLPLLTIASCKSFALNLDIELLDNTEIGVTNANKGFITQQYGLINITVSISRYYVRDNSLRDRLNKELEKNKSFIIEIIPSSNELIRGWFKLESDNLSGDLSELEMQELSFQLSGSVDNNFSWM